MSPVSVPRAAGALIALHGVVFAVHWVWPIRLLSELVPDSNVVGIANPLLFIAVAVCFWAATATAAVVAATRVSPRLRRLRVACAASLVVASAAYVLGSAGLPLGLDAVLRSAARPPSFPFRLSPNGALAFLLTGVAFLLFARPLERWRKAAFVACAAAVAFVGLAGIVGHLLGLEALYRMSTFNRILPPTALAFAIVGAGLWGLHEAVQEVPLRQIEGRIARRTLAVLVLVALGSGVAGFAVMRENFQASVAKGLQLTATTTAASLAHTVQVALRLPHTISTRPAVVQALQKLAADEADQAAQGVLQRVAENMASELDRVEVFSARGALVAQAGRSGRDGFAVKHPLRGSGEPATLGWNQAYVLVSRHEVRQDGQPLGSVVTEQRLPLFDRLLADVRASDESTDAAICSVEGQRAACAPTRFRREAFTIPLYDVRGQPAFPVVRALLGQTGVLAAKDPRGIDVISAHAPLGDLGLGLAVKTDVTTLYAPLRPRLALLALWGFVIMALAIYALRSLVRPVVSRLAESERSLQQSQARLEASERFMRGITNSVPALVAHIDRERRYTFANAEFARRLGLDPAAMIGRTVRELRPEFYDTVLEPHLSAALQGQTRTFDGAAELDGRMLHFRISYVPDLGPDGQIRGCYSLTVDITAVREAEQAALQASRAAATARQRLNDGIEALPAGFELYDPEDRLIIVNSTMKVLYPGIADLLGQGLTFAQLVRANWERGGLIVPDNDIERWIAERQHQRRSGSSSRTQQLAAGRWVRSFDRRTLEGGVVGVRIEITELVERDRELARLNEELQRMADTDPLTGVANRRLFERRLPEAFAAARAEGAPLALVMFDIDYFKRFNDHHGHPAGDSCLRRVAAVLTAALRGSGDLAARLGGEEFVVLLPGTDAEGACATVRRCTDLLRDAAIAHGDSPLGDHVTFSAGVAVLRPDEDAEQLIARTDAALYEAKLAGRARWHLAA